MADRPSRQLLVVRPRSLGWPYLLGATAGLCGGALALWTVAGLRPTARGESGQPAAPVVVDAGPDLTAATVPPPPSFDPPPVPELLEPPSDARSLDAVPDEVAAAAAPMADQPAPLDTRSERPLSRFSAASDDRSAAPPPWPRTAPAGAPPAPLAPVPIAITTSAALADGPVTDEEPVAPGVDELPVDDPPAPLTGSGEAPIGDPATVVGSDAAAGLQQPLRPVPPAPLATAPLSPLAAPQSASGLDDPEAPIPIDALPPQFGGQPPGSGPVSGNPAGSPFAAAPPLGTANAPSPLPGMPSPAGVPAPSTMPGASRTVTAGQGRPGPKQLEGVQTPQLTLEKRGPREVQVGQACRYEILVRNVGGAVAQDVVVHDTVPYGTTLVATSPPASPGADATTGDLVWRIGTLPPGSQVRVAVELMPTLEGEIGSLASVTFRAEAAVRARATKPALVLEARPTEPVLVGGSLPLAITVSNPGTGTATGVVLEGVVPEGLAHPAGRELEFDVGRLAPGQSRSIDLELGTTGPGVHSLQLVARADGALEVVTPVRLEVTAPTLEVAAEIPARRYLQRPATCLLSMHNAGTAPARDVELVAQLPAGLKFVRTNNAGYYDERSHRVLWNLEELPAAETGGVELVVMPVELGPQKIVAAARASGGLADQAVHVIEVEGLAALSFEVTDSEDPIEVGGLTEYVVRVSNQGTKAASGVRLVATLLGDVEPVAAKGPVPYRLDNLAITFEPLTRLAPAEEAVYRVRIRGRRPGDQRVQIQLTTDDQPAPITKEEVTRVYADR